MKINFINKDIRVILNDYYTSEKGIALVTTLLIIVFMVALITEVVSIVHKDLNVVENVRSSHNASIIAGDSVIIASKYLKESLSERKFSTKHDLVPFTLPIGENGYVDVKIEDVESRLSIKGLIYPNGKINEKKFEAYKRLLNYLNLNEDIIYPLADWVDKNDESRYMGGETSDYYSNLKSPYVAKNADLDSIDELYYVLGYNDEIMRALKNHVRVEGSNKVNINTASKEVIASLSEEITVDMAGRLIAYRDERPFMSTGELRAIPGFEKIGYALRGFMKVKSNLFLFKATASIEKVTKKVEAIIDINTGKVLYWREN